MEKVCIMGIEYANATLAEIADECFSYTAAREAKMIATPNGEIAEYAYKNPVFFDLLSSADLAVPDGVSVKLAAKRCGTPLKERVPGVELAQELIKRLDASGGSLFLFGSAPGVAEDAAKNVSADYPGVIIAGTRNGYFDDDGEITADINRASPDVLFVCLGSPKQEEWMAAKRGRISCGVMLGLGGTLDVLAGKVKRAPAFWRKIGCEWLYRTIRQPSRIKRILKIPVFVLASKRRTKKLNKQRCQNER